jgi:chemotaxis protein methyltransferase CheR
MGLLHTAWLVAAAACASMALLQLLIWVRRRRNVQHLILALASLAAAGVAAAEIRMSQATTVAAFVGGWKLSNYLLAFLLIALTWFAVTYSGSRPGILAWTAVGGWAVGIVLNAARPLGLSLAGISALETATTPWGEKYVVGAVATDLTKLIPDIATLAFILLAFQEAARLHRGRHRQRASLLAAIALIMTAALIHTTLVDLGLLASPYLVSFAFLAIVLLTNFQVAAGVAAASVLADRVRQDDRRWRALLDGIELLLVRLRGDGTVEYVNPHFAEVTGWPRDEVVGRHFGPMLSEEERDRVLAKFEEAAAGRPEPRFEALLETRDGTARNIVWRTITLLDAEGRTREILSVGADITEIREAEGARDAAFEQVRRLKDQLEEENLYLKEEIRLQEGSATVVGDSDALRYVLHRIEQVAPTSTTVLIQGETGVGKELVARSIHEQSDRSDGPFVRLNCSALSPTLVETELFGHVAGAFTDAKTSRKGRFEMADGGTLFLDEVSELPREVQPKLLRVLQEGEFEPVGSSEARRADVRLIAATNRLLEEEVRIGRFREDLFYRLHVYTITVPPLRDRKEDIPLLVQHFLPRLCARAGRQVREVPARVLNALQDYSWPGNVRQLQNVLEEAVVTCTDGVLRLASQLEGPMTSAANGLKTLADNERDHIRAVLEATDGQVAGKGGAAEILDLHPNTLRSRMKKLGISAR